MFETFSFLPPLTDAEIARQVDYIVVNGWSECDACFVSLARLRSGSPRICIMPARAQHVRRQACCCLCRQHAGFV